MTTTTTTATSSEIVPGLGPHGTPLLGDYGSSDADTLVNLNNQFPNWLDTNAHPIFYRTLYPRYQLGPQKNPDAYVPLQDLPLGDTRLKNIGQKMAVDLMSILNDLITFHVSAATFSEGTRGYTLGFLFILVAIVMMVLSR